MAHGTSSTKDHYASQPLHRHSTRGSSLLPLHSSGQQQQQSHPQFRPRSALAREDLGRQAVRQARKDRMSRRGAAAGADDNDSSDMSSSDDMEMERVHGAEDGGSLRDDEETGLTAAERDKLKRQKKRRRRMDERVAGGGGGGGDGDGYGSAKDGEKLADRFVLKNLLINALFIGMWYFFSISISLYNKWMFTEKPEQGGRGGPAAGDQAGEDSDLQGRDAEGGKKEPVFPYPLFTTCAHMLVQFSLAFLVMFIFPRFRPRQDSLGAYSEGGNERIDRQGGEKRPIMSWWFYLTRIAPCGLATGTDIGLGNMSLKFISLTFYTMCKSSVLGFVLTFAFLFRLEKPTWKLCAIIAAMTGGVIMMVAGETQFDGLGFALVMTAAASSGFRWSLTQILLLRNPATSNPFASIFFLAPVMFVTLLIIAIPVEGPVAVVKALGHLFELHGVIPSILILVFPGCLAFCMTASEFALLQRSSVVTLSIAGIFKEVVTISAASIAFEDKLTSINISGLLVTIACIAVYNWMKISKMRSEARMDAHLANADYQPVHSGEQHEQESGIVHANGGSKRSSLSVGAGGVSDAGSRASPSKRPEDRD